jgi:hypothetical protein
VCFFFFRFVGCDSVFLEYSRIDVFASLELLLTFWVHNAYFRLVNLFRLQSFILLNVCSRVFSYGHICFIGVSADVLGACLLNSDWSTSLGFSLYTLECVVEIISLLKLGDSMVEIIFCFLCEVISSLSVFSRFVEFPVFFA